MPTETRLSLAPGQNGTKKLLAEYGDRLVRVRYRYDAERSLRLKTVELIIETVRWTPRGRARRREPGDMMGVAIAYREADLRARIKAAGGIWRPRQIDSLRRGFRSIYLCTNSKMTENQALYPRIGYVEYERKNEAGFDRVFYRKDLAATRSRGAS